MTDMAPPSMNMVSNAPAPSSGPWRMFALGFVTCLLLGAAGYAGFSRMHRATEATHSVFEVQNDTVRLRAGASLPMGFETSAVEYGSALAHPPVPGRVTTVETLTGPTFAPLSGRVTNVSVRIGAHVKQGDKLIEIRTGDLAQMQRELRGARLAVRTKQAIADRMAMLVESRAASQNDLMVARSELDDAKFTAQAADAKLRSLMVRQDGETEYWVLANRSGTVVQLDAQPGKQVGPNSEKPIATVADLDEVLILADVPQRVAGELSATTDTAIVIPGSTKRLMEKVESVSDVVDPDRQTVPVRIRAKNPERLLRPNAYVDVIFSSGEEEKHLQLPAAAVVTDGDASVVFVEVQPGVLQRRRVEIGMQTKDRVEILGGVKAGDKVVVRGALLLLNALNVEG
ncbi:MAG: efflux RND transporter periplasmic adaptor subunit [Deltaproteobacteria bacterium]|nr:efflux RND transporter periplasmic adaptor subunit [Deltaproteobacteria bacterium]